MIKPKNMLALFLASFYLFNNLYSQQIAGYNLNDKVPMKKNVKMGKLPNGLTYYIQENKKPENRAELQIVIKAGSCYEENDQKGLAHFIEHMCFNGTKNFPKNELVSFLESTGMRFGADVNASTGFDVTHYTLTIPLDKPGLLDKGIQVLRDWLGNTSLDIDEINKERGVILEEWRLRNDANMRVFNTHLPKVAFGSIYKDRMPIGDTAVIMNAPKEAFVRFYENWYRPEISAVIVVGDINTAEVEKLIVDKFSEVKKVGTMPAKPNLSVPYTLPPMVSIAKDSELQYPNITVMYKHPEKPRGHYGEYRETIITNIYNIILNNRLQELSRAANPTFLYAGGGYGQTFLGQMNVLNLVVVPKTDNMLLGFESLLSEAFRIHKNGITKSELERARTQILTNYESAYNDRDKTESMVYAQELSRNFIEGESVPGIDIDYKLIQDFMPTVKLEDINEFGKSLIRNEGMVITVGCPAKDGIKCPTEEEILASYRKIENSKLEAYKDDVSDKPLISKLPKPGTIKSKKDYPSIGVTELELSNKVKVYLKPTDFKNDEINMSGTAKGGTSTVTDKDFYSAEASSLLINESGLASYNATQLEKYLSSKNVRVTPFISDYSIGIQGSSTPKDIETFFQLVYLYFTAPRKDADAFKSMKSKLQEQLLNSGLNPNNVFRDTISAVMSNYNMREMPWTEESIEKINFDKAYSIYKSKFANAGGFTFTFVGNFKPEELEKYIKQYIASLPTGKPENWKDNGIKSPTNSFRKVVNKGFEPKSSVRIIMNGDFNNFTREERFKVGAMTEVFNIRLREVIREDKGGVYGISARPSFNKIPKPGYRVNIGFGTGPDKVEDLLKSAKDVIAELKSGKFDDTYLEKVKAILSREYETNLKENWFWMSSINQYSNYGEPIENIYLTTKLIDNLTKKDIVDYANKYLDMNSYKEFLLMPEE